MKKWGYRTENSIGAGVDTNLLSELGENGFELVQAIPCYAHDDIRFVKGYNYIFKKEIDGKEIRLEN